MVAPEFSEEETYAVGDFCYKSFALYVCTSPVTTAGSWNSSKWQNVTVSKQVERIKNDIESEVQFNKLAVKDLISAKTSADVTFNVIANSVISGPNATVSSVTGEMYNISSDINVTPGTVYEICGSANFQNWTFAVYDFNGNVVIGDRCRGGSSVSTVVKQIIMPLSASTMRISIAGKGYVKTLTTNNIKRDIVPFELIDNFSSSGTEISYTEVAGKALKPDGSIVDTSPDRFCVTSYIDVEGIQALSIECASGFSNASFSFYDAAKTFITSRISKNSGSYAAETYSFVPVPQIAKYLVVSYNTSVQTAIIKEVTTAHVGVGGKWAGLKWVGVGDSLTDANNTRATKRYFDYVSDKTGVEFINFGLTTTGYARGQDLGTAFYQRVGTIPTDADVVTIFGSFNDQGSGLSLGTSSDSGTTTIGGCINTTIDNIQARIPLANLGVVAPTPWDTTKPTKDTNVWAYKYVSLLEEICYLRSIPFLNLWICSNLRPWDPDFLQYAYSRDGGSGTHPDENGHKLIAPHFEGFLNSLLLG